MRTDFPIDLGLQAAMQLNEKIVALFMDDEGQSDPVLDLDKVNEIEEGDRRFAFDCDANTLMGIATGMAVYGLQPVVHIDEEDLFSNALQQLRNASAQFRYRSGGQYSAPMNIIVKYRGGIKTEMLVTSIPGIQVFAPSSLQDFTNVLDHTTRMHDPVVIYVPEEWVEIDDHQKAGLEVAHDFRKARVLQEGTDLTLVTFGSLTQFAYDHLATWREEGKSVELVDLRALNPLDSEAIISSVKKTGRLIILQESAKSFGVAAELAAQISEDAIDSLLAPVRRVAGFDLPDTGAIGEIFRPDKAMLDKAIAEVVQFQ